MSASSQTVTARYPHHIWSIDLTAVPTAAGLWSPLLPFAVAQRWPFCWWVAVVLDHFSRAVVRFAIFRTQPSVAEITSLLDRAVASVGRAPSYTITDQGTQFRDVYCAWCARCRVRPRYGAVGKRGSISVIEDPFTG